MPIEQIIGDFILRFATVEQINTFLSSPHTVAIIIGVLVAISTATLGTFLLLRKMSMTSDAISHTVLLGIIVAFLVMSSVFHIQPDLSSPWLIIGAAAAGVLTVVLTEAIHRSGLVKADAALGLAFPLLFAIAIILINSYADNVHIDQDSVLLGEIGVAWANTNSYCLDNCEDVTITPEDPRAIAGRECINCSRSSGITPRSPEAEFIDTCANCGTYTAAQAWRERLIPEAPELLFFPKAITTMGIIALINLAFVVLLYKELKLSTFDPALAAALGFHPGLINYLLMILVSITAVGAFDAVGSILVVAFFIIPPATAYLLTHRLPLIIIGSPIIGALAVYTGYDLARGNFLGILQVDNLLIFLDKTIGLGGFTRWNTSISASMVMMMFFFFLMAWVFSPRYGLLYMFIRRRTQQQQFADQMLMGHIYHHQDTERAEEELAIETLYAHMKWTNSKTNRVLQRLKLLNYVKVSNGLVALTTQGEQRVKDFIHTSLSTRLVEQKPESGSFSFDL